MVEVDVSRYACKMMIVHVGDGGAESALTFYSDPNDGSGDLAIGIGEFATKGNVIEFKNGVEDQQIAALFFIVSGRNQMWRDVNKVIVNKD